MQEVKKPKKPLIFYYVIVMLILLLFNFPCYALAGAETGTGSGLRNFYDHDEREKYW